jgi:hypothetical protein
LPANIWAIVDFPDPLAPSMATTTGCRILPDKDKFYANNFPFLLRDELRFIRFHLFCQHSIDSEIDLKMVIQLHMKRQKKRFEKTIEKIEY